MKVKLERVDDAYRFRGTNEAGRELYFDTSVEQGGTGSAVGPMQAVLMALGGCSGIDIVSILKKSRQEIISFDMELEAQRATDQVPAVFTRIHAHYILTGDLDPDKVRRAVDLSIEKYCSVSKMLEQTATITHSYSVNGVKYE